MVKSIQIGSVARYISLLLISLLTTYTARNLPRTESSTEKQPASNIDCRIYPPNTYLEKVVLYTQFDLDKFQSLEVGRVPRPMNAGDGGGFEVGLPEAVDNNQIDYLSSVHIAGVDMEFERDGLILCSQRITRSHAIKLFSVPWSSNHNKH